MVSRFDAMKIHAWCCLEVPDSATPEKTRNDAGFAAFHALSRRSIPDDESLPLDSRWRFAGDVVDDPVDAADFVDDA